MQPDTPTRRVRIVRDGCSPLWVLTCAEPCEPGGCQRTPSGRRLCWLGAASSEERARRLAERWGYVVQDAPRSPAEPRQRQRERRAVGV